jgi:thioredoxin-like negative regulator of GroEL
MATIGKPNFLPLAPADFAEFLASAPVVVLELWAQWAYSHNQSWEANLRFVMQEFDGRIEVRSANIDEPDWASWCQEWEVAALPALVCFTHGQQKQTLHGIWPAQELRELLSHLIDGAMGV